MARNHTVLTATDMETPKVFIFLVINQGMARPSYH